MVFSWNWWTFHGLFLELVDFSLSFAWNWWNFRGIGGLFVDFSRNWWTFHGFFMEWSRADPHGLFVGPHGLSVGCGTSEGVWWDTLV